MKENKNFKLKSICHSCVSENPAGYKALHTAGSSGSADATPRMTESGRSMVEMLGVLAVIGVLSVAGIAGYTVAMNKYRANELLNEASKRAAIVAMQIASGKTGEGLSVDEFTQPSGYLFGVDKTYASGGKTFKLTLSKNPSGKIDEAVCSQMKTTTGTNSVMQLNDDCTEITFNADLSNGEINTEPELGLKQNVPCGDGFCYEGESCVDAYFDSYYNSYSCNGYVSSAQKCCKASDMDNCPTETPIRVPGGGCTACGGTDYVVASKDHTSFTCCQKGTGLGKGYDGEYSYQSDDGCCDSVGGFDGGAGSYCCKGNGYAMDGSPNGSCCDRDHYVTVIAKKGSNYYFLSGTFNPDDYDEFHCCKESLGAWNAAYDEGENTDWCATARTKASW